MPLGIFWKICIAAILFKIAYGDYRTKRILNRDIVWLMMAYLLYIGTMSITFEIQHIVAVFAISVPLLCIACLFPGSIGGGDIKLLAAGGLMLGTAEIYQAFATGILLSGIYVILLLLMKKIDRKTEIALGPFLCMGILYVFCG